MYLAQYSVGVFKAVVLVTGTVMIGLLSFAAGAVLLRGDPAGPDAAGGGTAAAGPGGPEGGGTGQPGGSGAEGGGGAMVPDAVRDTYSNRVQAYSVIVGDVAGDQFVSTAESVANPATAALSAGAESVLPPFIGRHVPWMADAARFRAINATKSKVGGATSNAYLGTLLPGEEEPAGGGGPPDAESQQAFLTGAQRGEEAATPAADGAAPAAVQAGVPRPTAAGGDTPAYFGAGSQGLPGVRWTIQMARFATGGGAEAFVAEMASRGIAASVHLEEINGRWWHVVRAGSYARKGAAEAALMSLQQRGFGGAVVTEGAGGGLG